MDLGTLLGLVAGIGIIVVGIIQSGGDLFWFYNFNSVLIVLGGTLAATLVALPLKAVGNIFNILKKVFIFSGGLVTLDEYKLIQKLNIPYEYFPVERKFKGDSVTKIGPNTSKKNKIGVTWNIINN